MNNQSEKTRTKQTATYSFRHMTDWCRQNIHDLSIQKFVKEFQFKEKSKAYAIFLNILQSADLAQLSQIQEQIDAFKTWKTTSEADLFWEHVSYSSQRQITGQDKNMVLFLWYFFSFSENTGQLPVYRIMSGILCNKCSTFFIFYNILQIKYHESIEFIIK